MNSEATSTAMDDARNTVTTIARIERSPAPLITQGKRSADSSRIGPAAMKLCTRKPTACITAGWPQWFDGRSTKWKLSVAKPSVRFHQITGAWIATASNAAR